MWRDVNDLRVLKFIPTSNQFCCTILPILGHYEFLDDFSFKCFNIREFKRKAMFTLVCPSTVAWALAQNCAVFIHWVPTYKHPLQCLSTRSRPCAPNSGVGPLNTCVQISAQHNRARALCAKCEHGLKVEMQCQNEFIMCNK